MISGANRKITQDGLDQSNLVRFMALVAAFLRELLADHESQRDYLNFHHQRTGVVQIEDQTTSLFTFNASTKDRIDVPPFHYRIAGKNYYFPGGSAIDWDEGGETINTGAAASTLWGAWYLTIDATGSITATPMDQSGDMAYATEFAALWSINGNSDNTSLPAGEVLFGIITLQVKASQTFTADTTEFDNSTVINAVNFRLINNVDDGIVASTGNSDDTDGIHDGRMITALSTIAPDGTNAEHFDTTGSAVAFLRGKNQAVTNANDQAFTVADTINTGAAATAYWGGWLLLSDGTNWFTASADGDETASDQTYATEAAVQTALDALFIPPIYAVAGQITVNCAASDTFTANTEDLSTSDAAVDAINLTTKAAATAYQESANEASPVPPTLPAALSESLPTESEDTTRNELVITAPN